MAIAKKVSNKSLAEHFKEKLEKEAQLYSTGLSEDALCYLVNMLVHFSESRHFFIHTQERLDTPTLALLYKDALETPQTQKRQLLLRKLGDSALFIGALFPEKSRRRGIKQDYFIGMGSGAYQSLADQSYAQHKVFYELASQFPRLLTLVAKACSKTIEFNAEDIFALYQRWQNSGDHYLKEQLLSLGIQIPDSFSSH